MLANRQHGEIGELAGDRDHTAANASGEILYGQLGLVGAGEHIRGSIVTGRATLDLRKWVQESWFRRARLRVTYTPRWSPGNCGAWILRRDIGGRSEFVTFSLWEDMEQ